MLVNVHDKLRNVGDLVTLRISGKRAGLVRPGPGIAGIVDPRGQATWILKKDYFDSIINLTLVTELTWNPKYLR